jgi:hypothetical protein
MLIDNKNNRVVLMEFLVEIDYSKKDNLFD